jgi:hypothetical protein
LRKRVDGDNGAGVWGPGGEDVGGPGDEAVGGPGGASGGDGGDDLFGDGDGVNGGDAGQHAWQEDVGADLSAPMVKEQMQNISRTMSYYLRGNCSEVNEHMDFEGWVPVVPRPVQ